MSNTATPDNAPSTEGWDAITAALDAHYPGQTPRHWGTLLHARLGGRDFLQGISVYLHDTGPEPRHWHYVTYGMSELYDKETQVAEVSGWGFEFTFRLSASPGESEPPQWPLSLLGNLARYVNTSGNPFAPGHYVPLNGPITLDAQTELHAVMFTLDPVLGTITTPNGSLSFLQLIGVTMDELAAARAWDPEALLQAMKGRNPQLVTDLARASVLTDPQMASLVQQGTARDGSSSEACHVTKLSFATRKRLLRSPQTVITLGASGVNDVRDLLVGRIPFQRQFGIIGPECIVTMSPGERPLAAMSDENQLAVILPIETARALAESLKPVRGEYPVPGTRELLIQVVPSEICDADNKQVVKVIG